MSQRIGFGEGINKIYRDRAPSYFGLQGILGFEEEMTPSGSWWSQHQQG